MTAHQPRSVPREGLAHPVFDGMGSDDDLIMSLSFSPGLTDAQLQIVYRWMRALGDAPADGTVRRSPFEAAEPFVHENLFHARLGNLADPRAEAQRLLDELTAAGVQIKDSFFARWGWRPDGVMGPRRDPRAPKESIGFATARQYLDQLWDPGAPAPASEIESDLKGGFLAQNQLVLEHRGSPLYFPGCRIGYGVAPCVYAPDDERTEQVRRMVVDCFEDGWGTLFKAPGRSSARPQPIGRDGEIDQVEKILCGTRVGYMFTVEYVQLLDRPSPTSCRYREYELMEAVIDAIGRLGLVPVVTWQRFGSPLMMGSVRRPESVEIQIWEAGGDHSGHPGLDQPWAGADVEITAGVER